MGVEAMVEVHTANELEYALERGATIFLVNMWDRMTGRYFKDQAKGLASMIPMNCVAAVTGNIHTMEQIQELGFLGYDSVILGRGLLEVRTSGLFYLLLISSTERLDCVDSRFERFRKADSRLCGSVSYDGHGHEDYFLGCCCLQARYVLAPWHH